MRILQVITLLLVAVATAGCAQSTPADVAAGAPKTTTSSSPTASIDACKYLSQADAGAMFGEAVNAGAPSTAIIYDHGCTFTASYASHGALSVHVFDGPDFTQVLSGFKSIYGDSTPVAGYPYPALRSANGAVFSAQGGSRACTVMMVIKNPKNPDAFVASSGELCKKVLAG
ncbi:hypothetical protein [Kutzneria buriramensis]|uniref:DUF3558 domain-containing protein n=1 Tax=Kutzneria buriramensis TaxID=1045776 RepID=A0A3E0HKN7_9PSEU|nr:hypothetical protein [Kutzneria buriramensis]REH47044.1 hypothetical protein BCF44_106208 [Kutzneria buriramensis]